MRIRHKPWARPELAACGFFVESPVDYRGCWEKAFPKRQPIWMELGCGKGGFIARLAAEHPEINFLVLDVYKRQLYGNTNIHLEVVNSAVRRGRCGNPLLWREANCTAVVD